MTEKRKIPSSAQYDTFKGFTKEVIQKNRSRLSQAYLNEKRKDFPY